MSMNHPILLLLTCLLIVSCSEKTYENQKTYELTVNETVEIYYSTNSCCQYCFAEEQNLNNIEFLEEKILDNGPEGCAGCNYVAAYVFRAISPGTDTIKLKYSVASESCWEADIIPEEYIVIVR